jgi:hypothetical protein
LSLVANDEDARRRIHDVVRDGVELVDFQDSVDLGEESFEESGVAAGNAFHGGDGLCVGEVLWVERFAEAFPVPSFRLVGVTILFTNCG